MAHKYLILTDACCDLPAERLNLPDVAVVPLPVTIGGHSFLSYPDEQEMSLKEFYQRLRDKQRGSTAAPSPEAYRQAALPALERGLDVLYIGLGSALSATFASGQMALAQLAAQWPQRRIICLDSMSGSLGQGLLVEMAIHAREQGQDIDAVAALIERHHLQVMHCFTVDDMQHLARSGRLSGYSALLASFLQFKPILWLSQEGKIRAIDRARHAQGHGPDGGPGALGVFFLGTGR